MNMMTVTSILKIRENIVVLYKSHETAVNALLRFLMGLCLFGAVNSLGWYHEVFEGVVSFAGGIPYTLALSAVFAVAPPVTANLLLLLAAVLQISAALEITLIALLLGICVVVFYCRLEPVRCFLIPALLLGFYLKMPYAVVLFAGLYVGFTAIFPVVIGTAVWNFIPVFRVLTGSAQPAEIAELSDVGNITDSLSDIYGALNIQATGDMRWILTAFVFAMVIIQVYAMSRLAIIYAKEISVMLGGFLCIFGSFIAAGSTDGLGAVMVFTILSVLLVLLIRFFDIVLDYNKIEYVEFEDEDNYYYVKIVSKFKAEPAAKTYPAERREKRGGVRREDGRDGEPTGGMGGGTRRR